MPDPTSTVEELLELLDRERHELVARVEQVPAPARERRPADDAWSVADVLEHLARAERGIARLIAQRGRDEPVSQAAAVPLDIGRVRGRSERIDAPERIRPTGTMTAAEALRALDETRAQMRAAVLAAKSPSLDGCTYPHPVLGVLTLRDWISFVAHHEARHAAQVSAIAQALAV
jgi:uncharacterized damage-inducible protein DinB